MVFQKGSIKAKIQYFDVDSDVFIYIKVREYVIHKTTIAPY